MSIAPNYYMIEDTGCGVFHVHRQPADQLIPDGPNKGKPQTIVGTFIGRDYAELFVAALIKRRKQAELAKLAERCEGLGEAIALPHKPLKIELPEARAAVTIPPGWMLHEYRATRNVEGTRIAFSGELRPLDSTPPSTPSYYLDYGNKIGLTGINSIEAARMLIKASKEQQATIRRHGEGLVIEDWRRADDGKWYVIVPQKPVEMQTSRAALVGPDGCKTEIAADWQATYQFGYEGPKVVPQPSNPIAAGEALAKAVAETVMLKCDDCGAEVSLEAVQSKADAYRTRRLCPTCAQKAGA